MQAYCEVLLYFLSISDDPENFDCYIARRRKEACHSVVVEVPNAGSADLVFQQCSTLGTIKSLMHYKVFNKHVNKHRVSFQITFNKVIN